MQKESHYRIVGDKLQLSDARFDEYRNESIDLFSDIPNMEDDSIVKISDEEKNVLNKLVGKTESDLNSILNTKEQEIFNGIWERERKKSEKIDGLNIAIENCRHKIQSIRYSLSLIENEIKNPIFPVYERLPINLSETEFINDVILFEFESFLMQVCSSLDVLIHLLKIFYPCLDNEHEWLIGFKGNKGGAGRKTICILRKNGNENAKKLADLFETEVIEWIEDIYKLRNIVAHQSKVNGLQLFIIDNKNKILHRPQLQTGMDVLDYCAKTQKNLTSLFKKISMNFCH